MAEYDGLSTRELEKQVGFKVAEKVLLVLAPDAIYFKIGGLWYGRKDT